MKSRHRTPDGQVLDQDFGPMKPYVRGAARRGVTLPHALLTITGAVKLSDLRGKSGKEEASTRTV